VTPGNPTAGTGRRAVLSSVRPASDAHQHSGMSGILFPVVSRATTASTVGHDAAGGKHVERREAPGFDPDSIRPLDGTSRGVRTNSVPTGSCESRRATSAGQRATSAGQRATSAGQRAICEALPATCECPTVHSTVRDRSIGAPSRAVEGAVARGSVNRKQETAGRKIRPFAALNWSPLTLRPSKRSVT
jgi:hypothetical protein